MVPQILGGLLLILQLLIVNQASAQCQLTAADWQQIQDGLGSPNFFGFLNSTGDCTVTNPASLRAKYASCTTSLENVLTQQGLETNCRTTVSGILYRGNGVLTNDRANVKGIDLCGRALNNFVSSFLCNPLEVPGCPVPAQVGNFASVVACLARNQTITEREVMFATGDDKRCLVAGGFCDAFTIFQTCLPSVTDIVDKIYDNNAHECSLFFKGAVDVDARCSQSLASMYQFYCPKKSFLEENLIALAAGIPSAIVLTILLVFCCIKVRSGFIADHDVIAAMSIDEGQNKRDSTNINLSPQKTVHPELAAVMEKKSKYKGITFDVNTRMWRSNTTGMLFPTEMAAAQAAYLAQENAASPKQKRPLLGQNSSPKLGSQNSFSSSSSPIVAAYLEEPVIETMEEKKARRIRQLVHFYEYWDSDKDDIQGHTEHLFSRHNFTYIARAVKTKYGLVPPGWEEELEAENMV